MTKPRYQTTNWKHYNQVLINRGSLIFWIDEEAIQLWKQFKQVFSMPLRGRKGLLTLFLSSLNYRCHALIIHALVSEPKRSTSRSKPRLKEQSRHLS